ncbi:MAG: peptidoglycan recognition family protein [Pseudomonadota bacterium]
MHMKGGINRAARFVSAVLAVAMAVVVAVVLFVLERAGWFDPDPPAIWRQEAGKDDILTIDGHDVIYWGKPDARYSRYATRSKKKPRGIVVHFTFPKRPSDIVRYGHQRDYGRGGASFGYHFYVGSTGRIYQGAPLSRRTNHIKFSKNARRTATAKHLWSGNTIGISMVGGCNPMLAPVRGNPYKCSRETVSGAQLNAGLAIIRKLREQFDIPCREVYGHGELQTDRWTFEGQTLTRLARADCTKDKAKDDNESS